jgi:hypothetical protein
MASSAVPCAGGTTILTPDSACRPCSYRWQAFFGDFAAVIAIKIVELSSGVRRDKAHCSKMSSTIVNFAAANDVQSLEGKYPFNQLLHSFEVHYPIRFPRFTTVG